MDDLITPEWCPYYKKQCYLGLSQLESEPEFKSDNYFETRTIYAKLNLEYDKCNTKKWNVNHKNY